MRQFFAGEILLGQLEKDFRYAHVNVLEKMEIERLVKAVFRFPNFKVNDSPTPILEETNTQESSQLLEPQLGEDRETDNYSEKDVSASVSEKANITSTADNSIEWESVAENDHGEVVFLESAEGEVVGENADQSQIESSSTDGQSVVSSIPTASVVETETLENPIDREHFRVEQIYTYFMLKQQQENVDVLYDLKECLCLQGEFGYLDILKASFLFCGTNAKHTFLTRPAKVGGQPWGIVPRNLQKHV